MCLDDIPARGTGLALLSRARKESSWPNETTTDATQPADRAASDSDRGGGPATARGDPRHGGRRGRRRVRRRRRGRRREEDEDEGEGALLVQRDAAVILDVDGTLVDSNDAHARAWVEAFAEHGITVAFERVRRAIGMGGDKLMPAVAGIEADSSDRGTISSKRRGEIFQAPVSSHAAAASRGARARRASAADGFALAVASSAKKDELDPLLERAGVADLDRGRHLVGRRGELQAGSRHRRGRLASGRGATRRAPSCSATRPTTSPPPAARASGSSGSSAADGAQADLAGAVAVYGDPADLLARIRRRRSFARARALTRSAAWKRQPRLDVAATSTSDSA